MIFTAIKKDENDNIVEYDLILNERDISCLYKDRSGVYISTRFGKLFKVKYTLEELAYELNY